jgi:ferrochelatase
VRVRFVSAWHDHPGCSSPSRKAEGRLDRRRDAVVFTAHSLPLRVIREGDPYAEQVSATAAGVAAQAGLEKFDQACRAPAGLRSPGWDPRSRSD